MFFKNVIVMIMIMFLLQTCYLAQKIYTNTKTLEQHNPGAMVFITMMPEGNHFFISPSMVTPNATIAVHINGTISSARNMEIQVRYKHHHFISTYGLSTISTVKPEMYDVNFYFQGTHTIVKTEDGFAIVSKGTFRSSLGSMLSMTIPSTAPLPIDADFFSVHIDVQLAFSASNTRNVFKIHNASMEYFK